MRILHIFRAPVGGLFRHVRDLARQQAGAGHEVGIICDLSGGDAATAQLSEMVDFLDMGVTRLKMPRLPGPADLEALGEIGQRLRLFAPDVVHGHGAKGGLYARLAARRTPARAIYTPHGGSLHYHWRSPAGALFLTVERWLLRRTDGLVFVCDYERDTFTTKVGQPPCPATVVHNGLNDDEFAPVEPVEDAAEFVFVGEMRRLKGVDVLIEALAMMHARGHAARAVLVGDGPERADFARLVQERGLAAHVRMPGAMPARDAFALGRILVLPSRAESFPYVVLEAQAAGLPVIASDVGGIGEMLPEDMLVEAENPEALAARMTHALHDPHLREEARQRAREVRQRFSARRMAEAITTFYESLD